MAWNYIVAHGKEQATPLIKQVWGGGGGGGGGAVCVCVCVCVCECVLLLSRSGIQKYIERNRGRVKTIYNETVTLFYIHMISEAVSKVRSLQYRPSLSTPTPSIPLPLSLVGAPTRLRSLWHPANT